MAHVTPKRESSSGDRSGPTVAESVSMLALLVVTICGTAGAFLLRERQRADAQKTFDVTPARIGRR